MIDVRLIKNWNYPNIFRQTQNYSGKWGDVNFVEDQDFLCDFVLILNKPSQKYKLQCYDEHIWLVVQEPPINSFHDLHIGGINSNRVLTTDAKLNSKRYFQSHPAVPWHIEKSFDELIEIKKCKKNKQLSGVLSSKNIFDGHKKRLEFINFLQDKLDFDLFGKGFNYISDKWDGLSNYRYSFAIENYSGKNYWTEKVGDCFLSYTVPIYYGCKNLSEFFPENSFIQIDIDDPSASLEIIKRTISQDDYEKRFPSLVKARNLLLYKYQFFPYFSQLFSSYQRSHDHTMCKIKKFSLNPRRY